MAHQPIYRTAQTHNLSNRYYELLHSLLADPLMQTALTGRIDNGNDFRKSCIANLMELIRCQRFTLNRQVPLIRYNMSAPALIGYKLANIKYTDLDDVKIDDMFRERIFTGSDRINTDVLALLQLSISENIAYGETGQMVKSAFDLRNGEKYCTNSAVCISVQFIGPISKVINMHEKLRQGKIKLTSIFKDDFEYKLGFMVNEPKFREPGIGCVQGIHYFMDKLSAIKYVKTGFGGISPFAITITDETTDQAYIETIQERKQTLNFTGDLQRYQYINRHFVRIDTDDEKMDEDNNDICAICLAYHNHFSSVITTRCNHRFHLQCLKESYIIKKQCPLCRGSLSY